MPSAIAVLALLIWYCLAKMQKFSSVSFPYPWEVLDGFRQEVHSGSMFKNIIASLWRVSIGFTLATSLALPVGLWMGMRYI